MISRIAQGLCAFAVAMTLGTDATASTLTNGFTLGVTEGNKQNRRTVVGTTDLDVDAGVISLGTLTPGDIFGIYGRIVSAVDFFEFTFSSRSPFEIAFDLDGYEVFTTNDTSDTAPTDFVSVSGLVNQADVPGETKGGTTTGGGKEVKFSLTKDGGAPVDTFRTSNVLFGADDANRILFSGDESGVYRLRIDGQGNKIAALYDINITATPIPLPAGILLFGTSLCCLMVMHRRRKAG